MTLLRAAARTMLASYFVASGVKALRDPDSLVPAAEPLVDKIVPLAKQYAPDQVAGCIPEDTATLVRVNGALQVVGGLALATGKGRRLGACCWPGRWCPTRSPSIRSGAGPIPRSGPRTARIPQERQPARRRAARGAGHRGQAGLAWRAQTGGQATGQEDRQGLGEAGQEGRERSTDSGSDLAEEALAGGAALVGTVVASSRRARKQAAKQLERAQKAAASRPRSRAAQGGQAGQEGRAEAAQGRQEGGRGRGRRPSLRRGAPLPSRPSRPEAARPAEQAKRGQEAEASRSRRTSSSARTEPRAWPTDDPGRPRSAPLARHRSGPRCASPAPSPRPTGPWSWPRWPTARR